MNSVHYSKSRKPKSPLSLNPKFHILMSPIQCYPLGVIYTKKARILNRTRLAPDIWLLRLQCPEISSAAKPGQFVMVSVESTDDVPSPILKRALAVYSSDNNSISLLIRIAGDGTRKICQLAEGNNLNLVGPLGNGFDLDRARGKYSIITAGGSGIASVYMLARGLRKQGNDVCLVYGGKSASDLAGISDFQALDIPLFTATEDGSAGFNGLVTDALKNVLAELEGKSINIYTCGPNPMMKAVCGLAEGRSIPCQISVEIKMACGFGVCLGCAVKTTKGNRLACSHGPVFEASEFIWEDFNGKKEAAHE